jgi:hypothetical protein
MSGSVTVHPATDVLDLTPADVIAAGEAEIAASFANVDTLLSVVGVDADQPGYKKNADGSKTCILKNTRLYCRRIVLEILSQHCSRLLKEPATMLR